MKNVHLFVELLKILFISVLFFLMVASFVTAPKNSDMGTKWSRGHKNTGLKSKATARRLSALSRLEEQIKLNSRTYREGEEIMMGPLTDHDKKRIKKEIMILKERI